MNRLKCFILLLIFFSLACIVSAHPHIYVNSTVQVLVKNDNLSGVRVTWVWDKWSSENVLNDCDLDKNGTFNTQEIQLVKKYYFQQLAGFGYFTELYVNGRELRVKKVTGFSAQVNKNGSVIFGFTIPITSRTEIPTKIGICFNDQSYYVAFEQDVTVRPVQGYRITNFKKSGYGYYGVQFLFHLN